MDITVFTDLIATVGFPIAVVIALGLFVWRIYKKSEDREEALLLEIKENRDINAKALSTLGLYAERLGVIEQDVKEIKTDLIVITEHLE